MRRGQQLSGEVRSFSGARGCGFAGIGAGMGLSGGQWPSSHRQSVQPFRLTAQALIIEDRNAEATRRSTTAAKCRVLSPFVLCHLDCSSVPVDSASPMRCDAHALQYSTVQYTEYSVQSSLIRILLPKFQSARPAHWRTCEVSGANTQPAWMLHAWTMDIDSAFQGRRRSGLSSRLCLHCRQWQPAAAVLCTQCSHSVLHGILIPDPHRVYQMRCSRRCCARCNAGRSGAHRMQACSRAAKVGRRDDFLVV